MTSWLCVAGLRLLQCRGDAVLSHRHKYQAMARLRVHCWAREQQREELVTPPELVQVGVIRAARLAGVARTDRDPRRVRVREVRDETVDRADRVHCAGAAMTLDRRQVVRA